jgi:hypothetical protein
MNLIRERSSSAPAYWDRWARTEWKAASDKREDRVILFR